MSFESFYEFVFKIYKLGKFKAKELYNMYDINKKGYLNKKEF